MKIKTRNQTKFPSFIKLLFWGCLVLAGSCAKVENSPTPANPGASGSSIPSQPTLPAPTTIYQALLGLSFPYSIMADALRRAGLDTMLDGKGPFILLIPQNSSFENAGFTSERIATMPIDSLRAILQYHIIPNDLNLFISGYSRNEKKLTVSGDSVFLTLDQNGPLINGTYFYSTDIPLSNGRIFGLSKLLLPTSENIMKRMEADPAYSFFVAAVNQASTGAVHLSSILSAQMIITVFAPSNQAFRNAGYNTIADIQSANPDTLGRIISYHILTGRFFYVDLMRSDYRTPFTTLGGNQLTIVNDRINDDWYEYFVPSLLGNGNAEQAAFLNQDRMATNGVIHMINKVLLP